MEAGTKIIILVLVVAVICLFLVESKTPIQETTADLGYSIEQLGPTCCSMRITNQNADPMDLFEAAAIAIQEKGYVVRGSEVIMKHQVPRGMFFFVEE